MRTCVLIDACVYVLIVRMLSMYMCAYKHAYYICVRINACARMCAYYMQQS